MPAEADIRIGISGWQYRPWRGVFYPKGLPNKRELAYAASKFRSIEINGTFYSLKKPANFEKWAVETPDDFVFAVKGPRFITHMKRLKDIETPLANFLASGLFRLGPKLGPILWQLPANFSFDPQRIEPFLKILPRDTKQAAGIAALHDKWLKDRVELEIDANRPMRHGVEIRHNSFVVKEFVELLRAYDVALVCADTVEWPRLVDLTAHFMYCRLHGSEVLYASGYDDEALEVWAERVVAWASGREAKASREVTRATNQPAPKLSKRDVYVYFDNDAKVRAPFDAQSLCCKISKLLSRKKP
jgi:uncharacterized protein YecE (DUF72 family)